MALDTTLDDSFAGIEDPPDSVTLDFTCKGRTAQTYPDALVDIKEDDKWVRIPVVEIEQWVNKDGPAAITRTSKVRFPAEWGNVSMAQFINGFKEQGGSGSDQPPYDEGRLWLRDQQTETWVLSQYGYVGGVGPTTDNGVLKFFMYDPADLLGMISISRSWNEPTLDDVLQFVVTGTDDRGKEVGLEDRSIFDSVSFFLIGDDNIPDVKFGNVRSGPESPDAEFTIFDTPEGSNLPPLKIDLEDAFRKAIDMIAEKVGNPSLSSYKRFQLNKDNMVDHLEWVMSLIDGRWWFEPQADGPMLVVDATAYKAGSDVGTFEESEYARRDFVDEVTIDGPDDPFEKGLDKIFEITGIDDAFEPNPWAVTRTLNNNALTDIKPFNSLELLGETTTFRESVLLASQIGINQARPKDFGESGSPGPYTEDYPYVELIYPPLVERAGGYKYGPPPIESDVVYQKEAERQAAQEFRKYLAESTEGTIEIVGEPNIIPFDTYTTVPVCNETYPNANAEPITWEVNSVKHISSGTDRFKTELGVSIYFDESKLEITSTYKTA